eukprot:m.3818 g.3818  ORF g.3818 m.3818 type:complete len:194 (+) comp2835_c0_seq1:301-882(+)
MSAFMFVVWDINHTDSNSYSLDVGRGVDKIGNEYVYEGSVRNGKPEGLGVKTFKGGSPYILYGDFKNGEIRYGDYIEETIGSRTFFNEWTNNDWIPSLYDSEKPRHALLMNKVKEKAREARKLVSLPWTRLTNKYNKYQRFQGFVITILLCGQRLNSVPTERQALQKSGNGNHVHLKFLPNELWEMIISFALS